jgi:transcriptional regulator with XRE-family HTH domain
VVLLVDSPCRHNFKVLPMTKYVARTIKDRMKAIGMTQAWLAERVGVSITAVSKWTTDGKVARDNVPRVAAALGLTTDQLLGTSALAGAEATWPELVNADEKEMLELYRLCSQEGRLMLKGAAREGSKTLATSGPLPSPFSGPEPWPCSRDATSVVTRRRWPRAYAGLTLPCNPASGLNSSAVVWM